jgi:hypothetical protein
MNSISDQFDKSRSAINIPINKAIVNRKHKIQQQNGQLQYQ